MLVNASLCIMSVYIFVCIISLCKSAWIKGSVYIYIRAVNRLEKLIAINRMIVVS